MSAHGAHQPSQWNIGTARALPRCQRTGSPEGGPAVASVAPSCRRFSRVSTRRIGPQPHAPARTDGPECVDARGVRWHRSRTDVAVGAPEPDHHLPTHRTRTPGPAVAEVPAGGARGAMPCTRPDHRLTGGSDLRASAGRNVVTSDGPPGVSLRPLRSGSGHGHRQNRNAVRKARKPRELVTLEASLSRRSGPPHLIRKAGPSWLRCPHRRADARNRPPRHPVQAVTWPRLHRVRVGPPVPAGLPS